jgi:hypothetical protein
MVGPMNGRRELRERARRWLRWADEDLATAVAILRIARQRPGG